MAFISTGTTLSVPVDGTASNDVSFSLLSFNSSVTRPAVDTSTMATPTQSTNSTNLHSATSLPGKLVTRSIDVTFDFDPTQNAAGVDDAISLFNVVPSDAIVMTFSDTGGDTWTAPGYVTDYNASAGLDERVEGSMTIQLTGPPTAGW